MVETEEADSEYVLSQSFTDTEKSILISLLEHGTINKTKLLCASKVVTVTEIIHSSENIAFERSLESLQEQELLTVTSSNTVFSLTQPEYTVSLTSAGKSVTRRLLKELILNDTIKHINIEYTFSDEFIYTLFSHKI